MSNHTTSRLRIAALAGVALLFVLGCSGVPSADDTKPLTTASSGAAPAAESKAPAITYGVPVAADFEISLKILEKECFGSAGCNVKYRVVLKQSSAKMIDPSKTYEISYALKGTDDPVIGTLTISDGNYGVIEGRTGTPNKKDPTIKITGIEEQ